MVAAEVTMATAADIPTSVTVEVATTVDAVVMAVTVEVATTVDAVVMAVTMEVATTTVDTVGTADIGAIHTTGMEGAGDGVLALGGRIGDGDIRMATVTALRIPLPTLTTTRMIVLRDTHVLPTGTMTLRLRIPAQNPGATQQILGDRR